MILQDRQLTYTCDKDGEPDKEMHLRQGKSRDRPANDINKIQKFSKLPIYNYLYSRKGKEKECNSTSNHETTPMVDLEDCV